MTDFRLHSPVCNTSKLMLGDLSKHIRSCTSSPQKSLYVKYSERCKKLAKSPFQTYLQNNRTQGSIEQDFGVKVQLLWQETFE